MKPAWEQRNLANRINRNQKSCIVIKKNTITLTDRFIFENLDVGPLPHAHMKYPGYQVSVMGKLGNTKTKVFIDIGVGDAVKPTEITMKLLETEKDSLFE